MYKDLIRAFTSRIHPYIFIGMNNIQIENSINHYPPQIDAFTKSTTLRISNNNSVLKCYPYVMVSHEISNQMNK